MHFFTRRLFLLGAVLAALAMLMTPALAGADDDDDDGGGGGDRAFCATPATGCGGGLVFFTFLDASSGPLGENPTGTGRLETISLASSDFDVTCLQVTGNSASIGGVITNSNDASVVGFGIAFTVVDNTPVAPDLVSLETLMEFSPPAANTPNCGSELPPAFPVDTGDIVVQDNIAGGACPPGDDEDNDGLTDDRESIFSTLLGNPDSDLDGIRDGNDDANGNGEDDEDEDDDENDGCPDEDSDEDGVDDEDEDDD